MWVYLMMWSNFHGSLRVYIIDRIHSLDHKNQGNETNRFMVYLWSSCGSRGMLYISLFVLDKIGCIHFSQHFCFSIENFCEVFYSISFTVRISCFGSLLFMSKVLLDFFFIFKAHWLVETSHKEWQRAQGGWFIR